LFYECGVYWKKSVPFTKKTLIDQIIPERGKKSHVLPPTELRLPFQTAVFQGGARKGAAGLELGSGQRILAAGGGKGHLKYKII